MRRVKELWDQSLLFRRLVAASAVLVAALAVYRASSIPRPVTLPESDLNDKSVARMGQEMLVLVSPALAAGGLVLSYEGGSNQIADVRLESATLDAASAKLFFPSGAPAGPTTIGYTTGGAGGASSTHAGDTCHTTIEVRLAPGSSAVGALKLYQTDATAGQQLFRQVVLDAGTTPMEIEVHTDAPAQGPTNLAGCQKILTVGNGAPLPLPLLPVRMVTAAGKIDLHFNPANPTVAIVQGENGTFDAVSLGANVVQARQLLVSPMEGKSPRPKLEVRAVPAGALLSVGQLRIGSNKLWVEAGQDPERALAYADGVSLYNYDLVAEVQKNPVLSFILGIMATGLGAWLKKICFPGTGDKSST